MKFRPQHAQETSDLELAPMIDVVFLLLIFFLVSWQYARFERTEGIETPVAEEGDATGRKPGEIIINVDSEGALFVDGTGVEEMVLQGRLEKLSQTYPDQAVILRGDGRASYESIMSVMQMLNKSGIWNVSISTKKKTMEASP